MGIDAPTKALTFGDSPCQEGGARWPSVTLSSSPAFYQNSYSLGLSACAKNQTRLCQDKSWENDKGGGGVGSVTEN